MHSLGSKHLKKIPSNLYVGWKTTSQVGRWVSTQHAMTVEVGGKSILCSSSIWNYIFVFTPFQCCDRQF